VFVDAPSLPGYVLRTSIVSTGEELTLSDRQSLPELAGFDFSENAKLPFDDPMADVFVENDYGDLYLVVREDSDIMDIFPAQTPSDVILVPRKEWSKAHAAMALEGHEYVLRTWDHHYAKITIMRTSLQRIVCTWAYQAETTRPALMRPPIHR
jgi:hypothetical protein